MFNFLDKSGASGRAASKIEPKAPAIRKRGAYVGVGKGNQPLNGANTLGDSIARHFPETLRRRFDTHQWGHENAIIRGVSRHLLRDMALGAQFKRLILDNVLPANPQKPQLNKKVDKAIVKEVQEAWVEWAETATPFVNSGETFQSEERRILASVIEDGDALVKFGVEKRELKMWSYDGAEMVEHYKGADNKDESTLNGVIFNADGRVSGYWVYQNFYRDFSAGVKSGNAMRVEAADSAHIFDPSCLRDYRGDPWIRSAILRMAGLNEFDQYASTAMKTMAKLMLFIEQTADAPPVYENVGGRGAGFVDKDPTITDPKDPADEQAEVSAMARKLELEANTIVELAPGQSANSPKPEMPTNMMQTYRIELIKEICAAVGLDFGTMMGDYTQTNFSGARQGEINNRNRYMRIQKFWHQRFRREVFNRWLLVYNGRLFKMLPPETIDMLMNPKWQGVRWPWIDPLKDMNARLVALKGGMTSPQRVCEEQGLDFEEVLNEYADAKKMAGELQLDFFSGMIEQKNKNNPKPDEDKGDKDAPKK